MIRVQLEKVEEWPSWARHIRRIITIGAEGLGGAAIPLLIKELQSE
jgi:hypothetical protein